MFPLHDVLEPARDVRAGLWPYNTQSRAKLVMWTKAARISDQPTLLPKKIWWSLTGSNRRPHACKARALPAELRPHYCASGRRARANMRGGRWPSQESTIIRHTARRAARPNGRRALLRERPVGQRQKMVGLGRLELPTSRLSSARSNQLSYKPELSQAAVLRPASITQDQHGALSMEERETKAAVSRLSGLTDPFVLKSPEERS